MNCPYCNKEIEIIGPKDAIKVLLAGCFDCNSLFWIDASSLSIIKAVLCLTETLAGPEIELDFLGNKTLIKLNQFHPTVGLMIPGLTKTITLNYTVSVTPKTAQAFVDRIMKIKAFI